MGNAVAGVLDSLPRVEERFWEIYGPYMERLGYHESSLVR